MSRLRRPDRIIRALLGPLWWPMAALGRFLALLIRWLAVWLSHLARQATLSSQVGLRVFNLIVRPSDPNNVFVVSDQGAYARPEAGREVRLEPLAIGERRRTLIMAEGDGAAQSGHDGGLPAAAPTILSLSLAKGAAPPDPRKIEQAIRKVNHRFSYVEVLNAELKRMKTPEIQDLGVIINRLAKRWLDLDQEFEPVERRNRLDVHRTLRTNLGKYGGHVLDFKWATKELPVAKLTRPARVLIIGDVSHSMVHYVTICLYFMHMLNFRFQVHSYVFSEKATHSTLFLNGPGSFEDKVKELVQNAASWNAGTRFGSSLETIMAEALIDRYTYVVIATDGKVALDKGEYEKIHRHMGRLKAMAQMVVFLTPEAAFAQSHGQRISVDQVGAFKSGSVDIPIFDLGHIWYSTLGKYADRVYHVRTVQDLVDMCEDLYAASKEP